MSLATTIYFTAILLIGLPAAFRLNGRVRNPTAIAMVATWFICRILYAVTGQTMPMEGMILSDWAVIMAMLIKEDWRTCSYQTGQLQLAAIWHERTPWDRIILALFPVVWLFYFPILEPMSQFWVLWSLGLLQLMVAGHEALHMHLGHLAASRADTPERSPPRSDFTGWGYEAYE